MLVDKNVLWRGWEEEKKGRINPYGLHGNRKNDINESIIGRKREFK